MIHLHTHSWFSFLAGASSPQALAARAARLGQNSLALTDDWTLAGAVQHARACREAGIKPLFGTRIEIDGMGLVLLCADAEGYANLCDLLTLAHRTRLSPRLGVEDLRAHAGGLFCLADAGPLVRAGKHQAARQVLASLRETFSPRLFVERDEVIAWMSRRWGEAHTAMTANVITFRLRLAVREMAKVLGFPLPLIDAAGKVLPSFSARHIGEHKKELAQVLGLSLDAPALQVLVGLVEQLHGCPRHLGLHSGGMILSRQPLRHLSPIQTSANGVRQIQFAKDDVEALGLIKFDVLGLRMLSVVSEAQELIRHEQAREQGQGAGSRRSAPRDSPAEPCRKYFTKPFACPGKNWEKRAHHTATSTWRTQAPRKAPREAPSNTDGRLGFWAWRYHGRSLAPP
jgi:DNA polymerase III alpha subunit